jgi:uncharacterized protein YbjT (DUF2867 family)
MEKKIIAVVGATGAQGGALARAILGDRTGEYTVRALTRKPDGEQARALTGLGAKVVAAELDDAASMRKAFDGAWGAFCVTAFWEHMSPEKELSQASIMARAAAEARVEHLVWSTLEDTRRWVKLDDPRMPTLQGKYKVPHLDAKGEANRFFREAGVPTTYLHTSFFWENFIGFGMGPKAAADGKLALSLPMADKKLPGISSEDVGKCAYGIFRAGSRYVGKDVGIAGEHLTGQQMAAEFSRALERTVTYNYVPPEIYRTLGFPGADDLGNMFQFKRDFNQEYCSARDLTLSRSLNPELQTFAAWLARNKSRIPLG